MNIPIMLNVVGRSCLVVGGGAVGLRKALALNSAGAAVSLLSLSTCEGLPPIIPVYQEPYSRKRLLQLNPWLVVAATDSLKTNQQIQEDANTARILVMRVDEADEGDLHTLPYYQAGDITLAVSSGSPHFSQHLLKQLETQITPEMVTCAALFKVVRPLCKQAIPGQAERAEFWKEVFASPVLRLIQEGHPQQAKHLLLNLLRKRLMALENQPENEQKTAKLHEYC